MTLKLEGRVANKDAIDSESRVRIAVDMVEVCVSVCAEGLRSSDRSIDERELLERLRSRLVSRKRL